VILDTENISCLAQAELKAAMVLWPMAIELSEVQKNPDTSNCRFIEPFSAGNKGSLREVSPDHCE